LSGTDLLIENDFYLASLFLIAWSFDSYVRSVENLANNKIQIF